MAIVDVEDLTVRYGRRTALNGLSFRLGEEAVGLLGPNGAGKSTFMKTLLGFIRPAKGSVRVFDLPMPRSYLEVRHHLGYMPEREVISPRVSAVSFLTYCGCLYGMTRPDAMERAHEVLNYVGLGEARYRNTETYSTGMLQRVKFAAALIHDPKLLLLDEPTNGLDPDGRLEMLDLIRDLPRKRDLCLILSSHLLPDVEYVCDRIIMLREGSAVRDASLDHFTAVRPNLYEVRVRESREGFTTALEARGCTILRVDEELLYVDSGNSPAPRVFFEAAQAAATHLRHLRPVRGKLEEAFMDALTHPDGPKPDAPQREMAEFPPA